MLTILRYSLGRFRGQILGWGLSLALLGGYLVLFYDTFAEQKESMAQLIAGYPKELLAAFGMDQMALLFTPSGFINVEFFSYMTLIIGIFALLGGSGLVASDEESGTLDLTLSHPVSRAELFWGRFVAFLLATVAILVITWVGFVIGETYTTMDLTPLEFLRPFISLFGVLMFYGGLAMLLSMLLPSRRIAAMTTGILLVADFFVVTLSRLDEDLQALADFAPLSYYQGGLAIDGLKWEWVAGLVGLAVLFVLLSWWRFERRDIRVSGEGGWNLPGLSPRKKNPASSDAS